jgi:FtsH-binding integral membrane protein
MNTSAHSLSMSVADSSAALRTKFIRNTYLHLAGAIAVFVAVEAALLNMPGIDHLVVAMVGSQFSWLIVLGAFIAVSWIADKWARSDVSSGMQYLGLGLFVVAQAVIFLPMLYMAIYMLGDPNLITQAGLLTGAVFFGLTGVAFFTKSDFSWLGPVIGITAMVGLGVIVCSILFGFTLGTIFSAAMALVAAGSILYTTSNIIHQYRPDQHVAAALALFSAIALLFWYILRILMSRR